MIFFSFFTQQSDLVQRVMWK